MPSCCSPCFLDTVCLGLVLADADCRPAAAVLSPLLPGLPKVAGRRRRWRRWRRRLVPLPGIERWRLQRRHLGGQLHLEELVQQLLLLRASTQATLGQRCRPERRGRGRRCRRPGKPRRQRGAAHWPASCSWPASTTHYCFSTTGNGCSRPLTRTSSCQALPPLDQLLPVDQAPLEQATTVSALLPRAQSGEGGSCVVQTCWSAPCISSLPALFEAPVDV